MRSQFALLTQRRFGPYFLTQFLGAFNDNVFKNALLLLLAYHAAEQFSLPSDVLINLSAGLFVLPFFLFSAISGQLADKYPKARLVRYVKQLEIVIMLAAAVALLVDAIVVLIALLFLMGVQSSLFGPVKYGVLPQLVDTDELVGANGLVETGTFLAILLGTACGGLLIAVDEIGRALVAAAVVSIAVAGYLSARAMPAVAALAPDMRINWNLFTATRNTIAYARQSRLIFTAVCGISWFWFTGSVYLAQLPNFTLGYLHGDETVVTLLLALFSIGVGCGSLLCEQLTRHRVDVGIVPLGALGLAIFGFDLALTAPATAVVLPGTELLGAGAWLSQLQAWRTVADVLLLGASGGIFIVPLYAVLQQRSAPDHRARVIAANNIFNALLMVLAAIIAIAVLGQGFSIGWLFGLVAVMTLALLTVLLAVEPEYLQSLLRLASRHTQ
ncbi:MAG: MFS transporter [Gammaproteobacteria bacterium]|nr:MFS transporter [Gammaproteobacteria bacterium]NND54797.1 MFS transporter [Gammaproteobacteria bacterium]